MVLGYAAIVLGLTMVLSAAQAEGNAAAGKKTFALCRTCHSAEPGINKTGPSLFGIVGRKAGTAPGYFYSEAMDHARETGIVWNPVMLDRWLVNAKEIGPVHVIRLPDAKQRQDLIAYLKTLK
jgi:Cytochrome c2